MTQPALDHRRAVAERNGAAILDATERLLAGGRSLNMQAIAAEAGISRPTLYAHHATVGEIVEATAERCVADTVDAFEAARPDDGPAAEALERMLATSWSQLARFDALVRGAAEHLSAEALQRAHAPLVGPVANVLGRGQREGVVRTDMPIEWLVSMYVTLVHGADGYARRKGVTREQALELLVTTVRDAFSPPAPRRA